MVWRVGMMMVFALLAVPAAAHAADVGVTSGVLSYKAQPGHISNASFVEAATGTVVITRGDKDDDALIPGVGCTPATPPSTSATCIGVTSVTIDAGDMSDRITATFRDPQTDEVTGLESIPAFILGGDGNDALLGGTALRGDVLEGGAGNDEIDGSAGNDTIRGGDGNDTLTPNTGTDAISGGDGIDTAVYGLRVSPFFSLDGQDNDGEPATNEKDLIGADVENVTASAFAPGVATITGDGRANRLTINDGRGDLTGGDGGDVLEGGAFDDAFHARDGAPDTVICNGGTDTVEADTLDTVSPTCEVVSILATPGGSFDDRPPAIAWAAPVANASLSANAPSKLVVSASDDRGLAKVQFFDDDRLVCEDTVAPYECAYVPRGGDVGRNTLIAAAVDGAGQAASIVRAVTVRRFSSPGFGLALRPSRDRKAPYSYRATGRLLRPTLVSPSQGCSGTVTITAKRGSKKVTSFRTPLSRNCEYSTTVRFRSKVASKLRLTAAFGGNDVLAQRTAPSRTVRLG